MHGDDKNSLGFTEKLDLQCISCGHMTGPRRNCAALPERIPDAIWDNEFDHRQPYPRDHVIHFEAEEDDESPFAYWERLRAEKPANEAAQG